MKVLWLSDLVILGSGYKNLSIPLCEGLVERGHEVKVIGLKYRSEEHWFPFSILPAEDLQQAAAMIHNLRKVWDFDVLCIALDINIQEQFLKTFPDRRFKYIGVFPIESIPLTPSWAMVLMQMNKPLVISEFGTKAAKEANVENAEYLEVGIDSESWKPASDVERNKLRESFGFGEDTFVVLTVADNHERKHLSRSMEIFADFLYDYEGVNKQIIEEKNLEPVKDAKYVLVTREHLSYGWRLRDYAQALGISGNLMIFERGMPFKELWAVYAVSDCFLLASKAEGLGLPILEAMSMKIPCVATDCTGMKELLSDNRGYLIEVDYVHTDPFGNGLRYFASRSDGYNKLQSVYENILPDVDGAREYMEKRDWSQAVDLLDYWVVELSEEKQSSEVAIL